LKPRWLAAALKSGKKLEQFSIAGPAKAASASNDLGGELATNDMMRGPPERLRNIGLDSL
jgi:hypothetical protein